jgi:hypothetical protein
MGEHSLIDETRAVAENPTPSNLSAMLEKLEPGDLAPKKRGGFAVLIAVVTVLLIGGGVLGFKALQDARADREPAIAAAPADAAPSRSEIEEEVDGGSPWGSEPDAGSGGKPSKELEVVGARALFGAINGAGGHRCTRLTTENQAAFKLELAIDARGRATAVDVSPRAMRRDKLARCLGRAARKARFPKKKSAYTGEVTVSVETR